MTPEKPHKTQLTLLFILTLLAVILMAISFWNLGMRNKTDFNAWPFILLILALIGVIYTYLYSLKITDPLLIEKRIIEKVEEARSLIMAEFQSKEEEVINKEENLEEIIQKIMPKGKFKTHQSFAEKLLANLSKEIQASIGIVYLAKGKKFHFLAGFALPGEETPADFSSGENLNGQVAQTQEVLIVRDIPEKYFHIESGLGNGKPNTLVIAPILENNTTVGIIEIATFIKDDDDTILKLLDRIGRIAGEKLTQIQKS
jgi:hypothetical protein